MKSSYRLAWLDQVSQYVDPTSQNHQLLLSYTCNCMIHTFLFNLMSLPVYMQPIYTPLHKLDPSQDVSQNTAHVAVSPYCLTSLHCPYYFLMWPRHDEY